MPTPSGGEDIVGIGCPALAELFSRLSVPFVPFTPAKIAAAFGQSPPGQWPAAEGTDALDGVRPGASEIVPAVLITKVEDVQVAEWLARFGGIVAAAIELPTGHAANCENIESRRQDRGRDAHC